MDISLMSYGDLNMSDKFSDMPWFSYSQQLCHCQVNFIN
jgi:hypothetical protein